MTKTTKILSIALIVVIILILAGGVSYIYNRKSLGVIDPNKTIENTKTYTNEKYGLTFKYPSDYLYTEDETYEPVGSRRMLIKINNKDNLKSKEIQIHISAPGFSSPDGIGSVDVSDYNVCGIKGDEMKGSPSESHSFLYQISRGSQKENSGKYSYTFYLGEESYQSNENRAILKSMVDNCIITK